MKMKRDFGELEFSILRIFKTRQRLTVRDVLEALDRDDKYTTIMTVMNRMVKKNLLSRERAGQQYIYRSENHRQTHHPSFLHKLKQKIFDGKSATMVSYLIESSDDMTDAELEEIEQLIRKLRKS